MTRKNRKDRKNKTSKKRIAKRKGGDSGVDELTGRSVAAVSPRKVIDLPPYHPIRALLGVATQAWELSVIDKLTQGSLKGRKALPDLNKLGRLLEPQDLRNLAMLKKKMGTFKGSWPPPPQIELEIEGIEPTTPSTWAPNQDVRVGFVVRNNSGQPTSGFVYGSATQGVLRTLVSSRWFQEGAVVTNLPSGQAFIGVLELKYWTAYRRLPGSVDISLEYWVEDPNGTITFVWGLPGNQQAATYNAISFAQSSFGAPISFATDIRPLFRDYDVQAMRSVEPGAIDLASYQDVKNHATEIYNSVGPHCGSLCMPCDMRWPADWVDTFEGWMVSGMLP